MKKKRVIIAALVLVIICLLIFLSIPKIKLDKSVVEVNVFDEYTPISYKASSLLSDLTDKVQVDGIVDTNLLGEYNVTYRLQTGAFDIKKVLKVRVVDKIAPELNLNGDEDYKVCSLSSFIEPGYTAIDNYDGDLTGSVLKRYINDNTIEYSVLDKSGNESKKNRKLIVSDEKAPEIKLKGDDTVYVEIGSNYQEQGASATDNCEGDLSKYIDTEGSVDTSKIGEYKITYKVKDSKGNENVKERKVIVQEKKQEVVVDNSVSDNNTSGVIYLTFDDGPGSYTDRILDTLKANDVKATFFVTLAGADSTLKREYDEGHTVALHTATHKYDIYDSVDAYFADLNRVSERVKNVTGYESKYIRFPGGSSNTVSRGHSKGIMTTLSKEVQNRGYKYYDWNVDVNDAGSCVGAKDKVGCVLKNFKSGLRANRGNVVLMHDIKSYTAEALDSMIKYGKEKGYIFKAIDDEAPTCHHGINN